MSRRPATRISTRVVAAASALVLVVASCTGGDPDTQPTTTTSPPSTTATTVTPTTVVAGAFVTALQAIATDQVSELEATIGESVAEGSPAAAFIVHSTLLSEHRTAAAKSIDGSSNVFELCDAAGSDCSRFDAPEFTANGRLFDFAIDDQQLSTSLGGPSSVVTTGEVDASVLSARRHDDGRLVVIFEVSNNGEEDVFVYPFASRYDDVSTGAHDGTTATASVTLAGGESTTAIVVFADSALSGTLTVAGADSTRTEPWQITLGVLPVR